MKMMKIRKWWEHLKNNSPESPIFHEECSENPETPPEPEIINPEFEEKPVAENSTETSEDFHFQSHLGLISTLTNCFANTWGGGLSIPPWSDFNI